MSGTFEELLDLYGEGVSIEDIASEIDETPEDVLESLQHYRQSQKVKGQYGDDIMKLIARRDCRGVMRKQIMEELNISRSLLAKAIERFGFMKTVREAEGEEMIGNVDMDFEFTECPECQSHSYNEITTIHGALSVKGIYCKSCGGEFFKHENELYKVKWENID